MNNKVTRVRMLVTRGTALAATGYIKYFSLAVVDNITHDRPDLSSERAPQEDKTVTLKKKNLWSKVPDWARHQDILTD
jgi:hypothetical protein